MVALKIKFFDIFISIIYLSLIIIALFSIGTKKAGDLYVIIDAPTGKYIYPLSKNITAEIPGKLGISKIKIYNNTAKFIDSPCKNKLCIKAGPLKKTSDWAACLPNQIFVRISTLNTKNENLFNKGRIKDMNNIKKNKIDAITN